MSAALDFTPSAEAVSSQCDRLLAYLREHGEATSITIRDDLGIAMPAARIYGLRWAYGIAIQTVRGVAIDLQGRKHSNAVYVLRGAK